MLVLMTEYCFVMSTRIYNHVPNVEVAGTATKLKGLRKDLSIYLFFPE